MNGFEFGLGVTDITPEPGIMQWGYSNRSGPATGTMDPLHAKAMVFRCGGDTAAWVALDLGRAPLAEERAAIQRAAVGLGIQNVALHATHTHHAPALEVMTAGQNERMTRGIVEAMRQAVEALEPARLGFARTIIDIGHNRRKLTREGECIMIWRNENRVPTSPLDQEAVILKIENASGDPLAVVVHFACHPVVMDASNLEYSGDYVGEMARLIKGVTGIECVFLQGGCGDINPYLDKIPMDEGGLNSMHTTGRIAAEAVMRELGSLETHAPENPSLKFSESLVEVGVRWDMSDRTIHGLLEKAHQGLYTYYMRELKNSLAVPLAVLLLNDEYALMGMPGELFVEHQLRMKQLVTVRHALLCGYVNDFHGYFPPVEHAAAGGYGGSVGSYVGIGAADMLCTRAQSELFRLKGCFKERYTAADFLVRDQGALPE